MSYWRSLICRVFSHRFNRWHRIKDRAVYERECLRCGTVEIDAARTPILRKRQLRLINDGDTTQPKAS